MTGRRRALVSVAIVAALLACAVCLVAPRVSAIPRVLYVHVSDGGVDIPGAHVNLTDTRSGWRGAGETDNNGTFFFGIPFEDPGFSVVRGDTIVITAAKGGRIGMTSIVMQEVASATMSISLSLGANAPPAAVAITGATPGENYIDVTWGESADADFGEYVVYVSTSSGTYGSRSWNSSNLKTGSCRVDGLEPGTRYYIRVAVFDAGGVAAYSEQRAVTTEGSSSGTYVYLMVAIVISAFVLIAYLFFRSRGRRGPETPVGGHRRRRRVR